MKHFILVAVLALTVMTATATFADNETPEQDYSSAYDPEWVKVREALNNTQTKDIQERCAENWALIWPWAKKGNYEARIILLMPIISMMHQDILLPPLEGNIDEARDNAIRTIGVHTIPVTSQDTSLMIDPDTGKLFEGIDMLHEMVAFYIKNMKLPDQQKKPYLDCLKQTPSHACADIAVKDGIAPSFEEYSAKIDALMAKGIKASCIIDGRGGSVTSDGVPPQK